MLDQTDIAILEILRENARVQWKEIGERVHMTGQAVAGRIARLQELGILKRFTIEVDDAKLGRPVLAFVTVFMKSTDHVGFQRMLASEADVAEAHRVNGEGCYWLRVRCASQAELTRLLDRILPFGNCRVNLSMAEVK